MALLRLCLPPLLLGQPRLGFLEPAGGVLKMRLGLLELAFQGLAPSFRLVKLVFLRLEMGPDFPEARFGFLEMGFDFAEAAFRRLEVSFGFLEAAAEFLAPGDLRGERAGIRERRGGGRSLLDDPGLGKRELAFGVGEPPFKILAHGDLAVQFRRQRLGGRHAAFARAAAAAAAAATGTAAAGRHGMIHAGHGRSGPRRGLGRAAEAMRGFGTILGLPRRLVIPRRGRRAALRRGRRAVRRRLGRLIHGREHGKARQSSVAGYVPGVQGTSSRGSRSGLPGPLMI